MEEELDGVDEDFGERNVGGIFEGDMGRGVMVDLDVYHWLMKWMMEELKGLWVRKWVR
ncbi:hypothetical protein [Bacillus altitudinis]|uniref:hypothetical protein n=1 Tax=Bacillus altitudinis TaxID=293387 RepID=UPI001643F9BA|nr:hypothetical protein [Bacillus altitudinis]